MTAIRILALAAVLPLAAPAWADDEHPATCQGFIGVMEAAARTMDPTGPQAYINLADRMYVGMNGEAARRGIAPLALPADENSEATRSMVVVRECQSNMQIRYAEAVTNAYLKLRAAAGLSNNFGRK